eukprot:scaffold8194_cov118-Cylindrotheca_fusiformis.AAC.6
MHSHDWKRFFGVCVVQKGVKANTIRTGHQNGRHFPPPSSGAWKRRSRHLCVGSSRGEPYSQRMKIAL